MGHLKDCLFGIVELATNRDSNFQKEVNLSSHDRKALKKSFLPTDVCFEAANIQYGNRESGQIDSFNPEAPGIREILARAYLFKNNDYEFEKEVRLITESQIPECGRVINNVSANQLI